MTNNPYNLNNLPLIMRQIRKDRGLSQYQQGQLMRRDQREISNIENGLIRVTPDMAIKWFTVLDAYEHIDLVHYLFKLHPMATAPVNPELNNTPARAITNLKIQMRQALQALENIEDWMLDQRPGKRSDLPIADFGEVSDIDDALKTFFYAASREFGLNMVEVADRWTRKAIVQHVAMPQKSERKEAALI
ncbi:helix-turn-helix domain-containing protein [Bacillus gobiensis]|uniref:helix-turn-helix domain-containing protein n=1 Tax=Bacillus gobiensis TaxID=1441095 RepID=UPI003D1ABDF6